MGTVLKLALLMAIFAAVQSKTYWEDIEFLKQLKNAIDKSSISPGSCVGSWDFSADPCDNLFGRRFTCGFRCDVVSSGASRLTELALDPAGYSGSLSPLSWSLPFLENLDLSNNFFSGAIPDSFSNSTSLRRLILSGNSFSGEIPASISSLANLEELYLNNNDLTGGIPASFRRLVGLKRLELQSNRFTGGIPELPPNLYYLDVGNNGFSGELPANLPESLIQLSMRTNSLTGPIPETLRNLVNLQVVDLSHNRFTGVVPACLFEHPSLEQLTISFNSLSGVETPASLGAGSELIAVDLSNNGIRGFLPAFMAVMPKLSALSLENNSFTGMIPVIYAFRAVAPAAGESQLVRLLLAGNYLVGPIPDALRKLSRDSVNVRLGDNCLYYCPAVFFFCEGGEQKSMVDCNSIA